MCFNNSWNSSTVLSLLLISWLLFVTNNSPPSIVVHCDFTVGYLTKLNNYGGVSVSKPKGLAISGAIKYAIEKVNNGSKLHGHRLNLIWNWTDNDDRQNPNSGRRQLISALTGQWKRDAIAFFGPEDTCDVEAHIVAAWNLPMISYKCTDSTVSNKEIFPTFVRTFPPDTQVTKSLAALLIYYHWKTFAIIWEDSDRWGAVADSLKDVIKKHNLTANETRKFTPRSKCCSKKMDCCDNSFFSSIVDSTAAKTRVYVFLGPTNDLVLFMRALHTKELLEHGEYIVVSVDLDEYNKVEGFRYIWESHQMPNDIIPIQHQYYDIARSLLVIAPTPPTKDYDQFEHEVRRRNKEEPFRFRDDALPDIDFGEMKKHVGIFAAYLYDSVMLYADAVAEVLNENGTATNGTAVISKIIGRKYNSISGFSVQIDKNGDAEGNFSLLALADEEVKYFNHTFPKSMIPVGIFLAHGLDELPKLKLNGTIPWKGGSPPLQEPHCGFDGSKCYLRPDTSREIASGILGGLLVVVLASAIILYRNWKYEQEIAGLLWKINLKEIQMRNNGLLNSYSGISLLSQTSMESRAWGQVFTNAGSYKGTIVAVKQLTYRKKLGDLPRATKIEMKLMREIRHDNINPYIGSCVEPNQIYIVTEYCSKGSLLDILENDDIKLDDLLIASLIWDLIKGMIYLHDSDLKLHGNLKSSNCVVTSRWVLQITDFGLHDLRRQAQNTEHSKDEYSLYWGQFWTAPEILRDPHLYLKGSQKGDVYSFGIIIFEIFGREGPYTECQRRTHTPFQIIEKVKEPVDSVLFRPDVNILQCQSYVINCLNDCWQERPEDRPDFRHIRDLLKDLRQGMKRDIYDNMMDIMEKHANHLEELVEQRTGLLAEEKKKTETLLHRMLPPPVAAALIRGEYVVPESFDAVTIYFSDIVGFTEMSAQSTPMEVVTFLNGLYTVFDNAISKYDVYKVETIGDAYMVVSGLPIPNKDEHAGEIASMALDLLTAVKTFMIPHRPEETLKLRIGIHTGPVVAGVVGKTMPRYCLFGDTVNTASRMESNGEALKIHISQDCKTALDKLPGYEIVERGPMNIKGKGQMTTYWLLGQSEETGVKKKDPREISPLFSRGRMDSQEPVRKSGRGSIVPKACSQSSRSTQDFSDKQAVFCPRNYSPVRTISFYNSRCDASGGGGGGGGGGIQEKTDSEGGSGETLPADEKASFHFESPSDLEEEHQEDPPDTPLIQSPPSPPLSPLPPASAVTLNNMRTLDCNGAEVVEKLLNNGIAVPILDDQDHHHHQSNVRQEEHSGNVSSLLPSSEVVAVQSNSCHKSPSSLLDETLVSQTTDELTHLIKCSQEESDKRTLPLIKETKKWRSCSEISPLPTRIPQKSLKNWFTGLFNYKDGFVAAQNSQLPRDLESVV